MWRGINFGGALDGGPDWIRDRHFDDVRDAGLNLVRVPVKWAPDSPEFERVDEVVASALRRDLDVIVDVHHFDELSASVEAHRARFLALWARLAEHYAEASPRLHFELLNEPHDPMTAEEWNSLLPEALAVVREINPGRLVIVGPTRWNILDALSTLRVPDDDNLVVTFHYYSPFRFTHQGAGWVEGAGDWLGTTWGTEEDHDRVAAEFEKAASWAATEGRQLFLGEFGAMDTVDLEARAQWAACVRSHAEQHGIGWAYWNFACEFAAFDLPQTRWHPPLREALLPSRRGVGGA